MMPYGRYGGYGGQVYDYAQGQNPFWNPMSPTPDFAGGIRSTIQQLLGMKQMREQQRMAQEQQMWERQIEERKMAAQQEQARVQAEALEKYRQESLKTPDEKEADRLYGMGQFKDWQAAYDFVIKKGKAVKEPPPYEEEMATTLRLNRDKYDAYPDWLKEKVWDQHFKIAHPNPTDEKGMTAHQLWQQNKDKQDADREAWKINAKPYTDAVARLNERLKAEPEMDMETGLPKKVNKGAIAKAKAVLLKAEAAVLNGKPASPEADAILADLEGTFLPPVGNLGGEIGQEIGPRAAAPQQQAIPPAILAEAKRQRPDLSEEEIIRRWQAQFK